MRAKGKLGLGWQLIILLFFWSRFHYFQAGTMIFRASNGNWVKGWGHWDYETQTWELFLEAVYSRNFKLISDQKDIALDYSDELIAYLETQGGKVFKIR